MKIEDPFAALLCGKNLPEPQARKVFHALFLGNLGALKAKALLLLLAKKGEAAEEVTGCLKALRKLEQPYRTGIPDLIDTCGTGGDGSHSINVSTLAALVIAGAGGKVAKHGNRGLSSPCGSSDLLESLGVKLNASSQKMIASIRKHGIGYFHAPYHHPVFSRMQPLRKALKTRTLFNLLGPLCNPVQPPNQLVGVSRPKDFKLYTQILKNLGVHALVCNSLDGLDEISISAPTRLAHVQKGKVQYRVLHPQRLGFKRYAKKDFIGGGPAKNKRIALKLLKGDLKGPVRDIIVLNAAAGLWICGKAKNLKEGIRLANQSLDSGRAYQALVRLRKL